MFITKGQLDKLIDEKIGEAFKRYGFKTTDESIGFNIWGIPVHYTKYFHPEINKINVLTKHLGLEYYKEEKEYVQEGFRKIKGRKITKK